MAVTTKFGIIFLLAPFVVAVSFFSTLYLLLYLLYRITPDLSPDLVPNLISMALVWLLVWERLRGSLIKDLKWFHRYVLFKLYSKFQPKMSLYHVQPNGFKKLRADLEEYSRSILRLRLYPRELPEMIDEFLELNEDFSPKLEKIEKWGKKELGGHYTFRKFLYYLGIEPVLYSVYSKAVEDAHRDGAQRLLQEQPDLVEGTINLLQKMGERNEQIHDLLEDFMKDNKLSLEKEKLYTGYP